MPHKIVNEHRVPVELLRSGTYNDQQLACSPYSWVPLLPPLYCPPEVPPIIQAILEIKVISGNMGGTWVGGGGG